jgi:hypothetical protein
MKCDLCQREDARRGRLLCQVCAEAIARLRWISQCCPTTVEDRPSSACVTEDEFYFQQYGQIIYAVAGTKAK